MTTEVANIITHYHAASLMMMTISDKTTGNDLVNDCSDVHGTFTLHASKIQKSDIKTIQQQLKAPIYECSIPTYLHFSNKAYICTKLSPNKGFLSPCGGFPFLLVLKHLRYI